VEKAQAAFDWHLDELYRQHPEQFVASRNELAKQLRVDGDRDAAERLRKLRRPTTTAWLLNRVALDSPALVGEFAAASRAVADAQRRALEGDEKATNEWRIAAARDREAATAVRDAAERAARDAGHPATPRALELVIETLRATGEDEQLRERVQRGRVEREQSAATLGIIELPSSPPDAKSAKRREVARDQRERKLIEDELADAIAREERLRVRVEESTEALRRAKAKLAESKRETQALNRRLKTVERRVRV
jgi:hypothetical protein